MNLRSAAVRRLPALTSAIVGALLCAFPAAGNVLDPAKAARDPDTKTLWYDVAELGIEGRSWAETKSFFDRLPAKAAEVVPDAVWELSHNSAGLCVRLVTDATTIDARWNLTSAELASPRIAASAEKRTRPLRQAPRPLAVARLGCTQCTECPAGG